MDRSEKLRPERQPGAKGQHRCPRWLLEGKHSTRTNQARNGSQHGNGIRKKHQDETADGGIKNLIDDDVVHVGFEEAHVAQSRRRYASLRPLNRSRITFESHYLARSTDQPGNQHGNVPHARSKVEHTMTYSDTCFAE